MCPAVSHDPAGNRTASLWPTGESTYYAWDAGGQMASAEPSVSGPVSFSYNADGQRVLKDSASGGPTAYLYDLQRILHETEDVGGEITRTYACSTTDEFGDLIGEDGLFEHVYDAQANTDALLDPAGAVEARYKYDAFGNVAAVSLDGSYWTALIWSTLTANQWAGMTVDDWAALPAELSTQMLAGGKKQYYLDAETELYLLGSGNAQGGGRYYDAHSARFLSEDPDRHEAGQVNLFAYVDNDPVNKLDPSGHLGNDDDSGRKRKESPWQTNCTYFPRLRRKT